MNTEDNHIEIDFNVQWYPGHMTKTVRMLKEHISLVEVVIELLDARIPYSSKNPDIATLSANKHRIIALNKADLANDKYTDEWIEYYKEKGFHVIAISSTGGKGIDKIITTAQQVMKPKIDSQKLRGRINYPIRAMIVGVPNVGKSTLINKYAGKAVTKTADKPGVTRGKQWIKLKNNFELLDTPGILWPKFDDREVGMNLAFTGAINDNVVDKTSLALAFINKVKEINPSAFTLRYNIDIKTSDNCVEILDKIAVSRGFILKAGKLDLERTAITLIDEFRGAKLGNITLERAGDY